MNSESAKTGYGAPRIHAELAGKGTRIGRKWVARLMLQAGLAGVSRRRLITTTVKGDLRQVSDLVERNFTAAAPDRLWVVDITYIPTWAGFLYLAAVLDANSRRIVGWSMATTLATQLVLDALNMALATRRPRGVTHYSDQGSQYTSIEFGHRCRAAGVRPSMGSVGDAGACPRAGEAGPEGQCRLRELLRHARMRAARAVPVQDPGRGAQRGLRVHRATAVDPDAHQPAAARDGRTIVRAGTEEGRRFGECGASVVRPAGQGRQLPDRRVCGTLPRRAPRPDRCATVSAESMDRRSTPLPGRRHLREVA